MFNTGINHLFQVIDNPVVYWLLNIISVLGTTYFLIFVLFSIFAGIDFRKGLLIANIFGWTILFTFFLKNYIDYPRPLAVDSTLKNYGSEQVETDLSHLQPRHFFELFPDDLLSKTRESSIGRTGFPSGHTSSQIAVWVSLALFFRKRWLWFFSVTFVLLTMISRLFLAQHFLGDILGGMALGLLVVCILFNIIKRLHLDQIEKMNRKQVIFLLMPVLLIPLHKYIPTYQAGSVFGFNIALITIIYLWGNPIIDSSLVKKALNIFLYFIIFAAISVVSQRFSLTEGSIISLIYYTLTSFLCIMASTILSARLKLISFKLF